MESLVQYFKRITGLEPISEQNELLDVLSDVSIKNLAASAGRGFSKTLCCAVATLWFADIYATAVGRGINILLISSQAEMYDVVDRLFVRNPELTKRLRIEGITREIPAEEFEFSDNHSRVSRHKPTSKSIRSHRADIVILDEAAGISKEVINVAIGCLTGDINRVILISTPFKNSYFNEICAEPEKYGFMLKQFSSELCPWQKLTVERCKTSMTSAEYASEVQGHPPSKSEMNLFNGRHIDACTHDVVLREGGPNSVIEAGLDWGYNPCSTALVITEKITVRRKVLFVKKWHKKPIEVIAPEIAAELDKFNCDVVKADSMPAEYRGWVERYTSKKINYIPGSMHKDALLGQLKRKITQHNLEIPVSQKGLIVELRKYHEGKRAGDDLVDALAFSIYEPEVPLIQQKPPVLVYY